MKKAVERPESRLYRLPIPEDLLPDHGESLRAWQYLQIGQWFELVSRCQNVARFLMRIGGEEEKAGKLGAAYEDYRLARLVAGKIGLTEPHMFITVNAAIDLLEDAYENLARVTKATGSEDVEHWQGEYGIAQYARQELHGALQAYTKEITATTPPSVEELLALEANHLQRVIAGVGLPFAEGAAAQPAGAPKALPKG